VGIREPPPLFRPSRREALVYPLQGNNGRLLAGEHRLDNARGERRDPQHPREVRPIHVERAGQCRDGRGAPELDEILPSIGASERDGERLVDVRS